MTNKVNFFTFIQNAMEITDQEPDVKQEDAAADLSLTEETPVRPAERLQEVMRNFQM